MPVFRESNNGWYPSQTGGGYDIMDENGWALARVNYDYRFTSNATNFSRSHMIAAAPELYEALERMLGVAGYADNNSITEQAKAALAKARGETR